MRDQRNAELLKVIRQVHADSRSSYGSPRIHAELALGMGMVVNEKRVARLMRLDGLQGAFRRRGYTSLVHVATEEDLVKRSFTAAAPDELWVADITEHSTAEGKVYGAGVLDVFSRKIVGWASGKRQTSNLVIDAMSMAVARRDAKPGQTVHHSDHGCQYTSWKFGNRLRKEGLVGSMGTVGDCYDNAMMESFWGTMQIELLDTRKWETRAELELAMFEWIECWYNPKRRHSSLDMLSPNDFEARYWRQQAT